VDAARQFPPGIGPRQSLAARCRWAASCNDRLRRQPWAPVAPVVIVFLFLFENSVPHEDAEQCSIANTIHDESDDRDLDEITARGSVRDLVEITADAVIDAEKLEIAVIDIIVDADDDTDAFVFHISLFYSLVDA
jgi:hypothetical protein